MASEQQFLMDISNRLNRELTDHSKALPKGFNSSRFALNCVTMLRDMLRDPQKVKQVQQVDPNSIPLCFAKGAYLGLDFFNGECYAIPYGGTMQFQTDYKGELKLCKKWSKNPIKDIYAKVVREGDMFEEMIENGVQRVNFRPVPFSNKKMVGAFAVALFKDGSMMYDTMSASDIENVRNNFSKARNSPAWKNTPGEMYKKTVLRRLCKLIDLDFDTIEAQTAFEDGGDATFVEQTEENGYDAPVNVFDTNAAPNGLPMVEGVHAEMDNRGRGGRAPANPYQKKGMQQPVAAPVAAEVEEDYSEFEAMHLDDYAIPDDN